MDKTSEFEKLAKPLIKYLNDHFHPHVKIIIDGTSAEIVEGQMAFTTEEYIKD